MALSGVRLIIGLGALVAVASGAKAPAAGFHQDAVRLPMMVFAVLGSCIKPVHDLENSISPKAALGSMEAAVHYASAIGGKECKSLSLLSLFLWSCLNSSPIITSSA
jgi:hypothetical protein